MSDVRTARTQGLSDTQWIVRGALGLMLYALFVLGPIVLMVATTGADGRTFLREFSVTLAFGALSILGLQIVLTARLKRLKAPYGIDAVYHFHKSISFVALVLVLAHVALLIADDPATLGLFNVLTAPARARFAVTALVALTAVVLLSTYRRPIGLHYEGWRYSHGALALVVLVSAVAHVELVGYHVNTPWKRELWLAYAAIWVLALLWSRIAKPALMLRQPWRVDSVRKERGASWTLTLRPAAKTFRFDPGQFVWLHLGRSPFAMTEHPFSISSSATREDEIELTIKELGDFTSSIGGTEVGRKAYIDGPYGQFSVDRHVAAGYVFIAGGVGITPIMSMLRTMRDRADSRPITLLYGAESLDDMTFNEEINALAEDLDLNFVPVLSRPPLDWRGEQGWITREVLERHLPASHHESEFFVCGPEPMMNAVSAALRDLGVRPSSIRYELFGLV